METNIDTATKILIDNIVSKLPLLNLETLKQIAYIVKGEVDNFEVNDIQAIKAFRQKIMELDPDIKCDIYKNDISYLIVIQDHMYDKYEEPLNPISYEIHKEFDPYKPIVCIPNEFVTHWDEPLVID